MTIWDSSLHLWCFVARQNCLPQRPKAKEVQNQKFYIGHNNLDDNSEKWHLFWSLLWFFFFHNNCRNCSQNSWQTHEQYQLGWDPSWQNPVWHGVGWLPRRDAERETFILLSSVGFEGKVWWQVYEILGLEVSSYSGVTKTHFIHGQVWSSIEFKWCTFH